MKKIIINFRDFKQTIFVGKNINEEINRRIKSKKFDKIVFIVDNKLSKFHKNKIDNFKISFPSASFLVVKPIAKFKEYYEAKIIIDHLIGHNVSRKSCLIAIGGGYVADIVGFVASIYMRGISFIQIPTTLMSMGDAVMGKVAVNYGKHKNLVGSFYSPIFTFCDIDFIKTLSKNELVLALVEIWKHALLKGDKKLVNVIKEYLDSSKKINFEYLIFASLVIKRYFVEKDLNDSNGSHKALSLGHTFANYLEPTFNMRHGEAVFYGMILATLLSIKLGKISKEKVSDILFLCRLFDKNLNTLRQVQRKIDITDLLLRIGFDKINDSGVYSFVIPINNGYMISKNVKVDILKEVIQNFKNLELL